MLSRAQARAHSGPDLPKPNSGVPGQLPLWLTPRNSSYRTPYMARAGEELAAAVDRILMPAPFGLPREVVLRAKRESKSSYTPPTR